MLQMDGLILKVNKKISYIPMQCNFCNNKKAEVFSNYLLISQIRIQLGLNFESRTKFSVDESTTLPLNFFKMKSKNLKKI